MESIITIKQKLASIEKEDDWNEIIDYLYEQWRQQQKDGCLCILLVQQLIEYLLLMDTPPIPINNPNYSVENRKKFQAVLDEAINYGMIHCLGNKYFLWQICFYLSGISTYYFLYGSLLKIDDNSILVLKKMLATAKQRFPSSLLFRQFYEYLQGNDNWQRSMSEEEKKLLLSEVNGLQLQDNMEDKNVYDYFILKLC